MAWLLILLPLGFAAFAALMPSNRWRPWFLPAGGLAHLSLTAVVIVRGLTPAMAGWLMLDPPGTIVLGLVSVLFAICSLYAPAYLALRPGLSNRVFCACLLFVLSMMTLVILANHLGLLWVAIEATTLGAAPLLYFNHTTRSLEATWKYLLIGSVGIAMALLGTFFMAYAALSAGEKPTLVFGELAVLAPRLSAPWLHAAFVLLLVGYGTKMGLAPMHTWKPDAYGEAPGIAGALLAGGVTSCAFLAILRLFRVCKATTEGAFASHVLILMGLLSMAVAAVFMIRQRDFKRMLAYSSVEHMGILSLGAGLGGLALTGALLHVITNGITKAVLFLSAGNIHRSFQSKSTDDVQGAIRSLPWSGSLFLLGFLLITGSPPGGPFRSVFTIVQGALQGGHIAIMAAFLVLLAVVFIGMGTTVLRVVQGEPSRPAPSAGGGERILLVVPILLAAAISIGLGLHVPEPLQQLLQRTVEYLEATP